MARPPRSRLPLRLRVAAAYLASTAVALVLVGSFVWIRVGQSLDDYLHDSVEQEMESLVSSDHDHRLDHVEALDEELVAQIWTAEGDQLASSPNVRSRLLPPDAEGLHQVEVRLVDHDTGEVERVPVLALAQRDGDQVIVVAASRVEELRTDRALQIELLIGIPVALALAGGLGYAAAGAGLRPIERMRRRARTISDTRSGERLPLPVADDELRRLAVTLNAMLDRIDESQQRQRRFVADASHELRTPLALLRTEVELALVGHRTAEELRTALRSVEDETQRLVELSERLLLLASADERDLELALRRVDLAELAGSVVERFAGVAREQGREVSAASPGRVEVVVDPLRLDQTLSNLVDNALSHGRGAVRVAVASDDDVVRIAVTDDGPGFIEDDPFGRFVRSGGSTGLGLAIVDEIVRAHGGRVRVRPRPPTTVEIALPRRGPRG